MDFPPTIQRPLQIAVEALRRFAVVLGLLFFFGSGIALARAEPTSLELQVKAAFLVKFGMFVEWSATGATTNQTKQPFVIGVLGADPFGEFLDEAAKREFIRGRPVQVSRAEDAAKLAGCQIVFIAAAEARAVKEALAHFKGQSVLTVGDAPNFARRGGMIGFIKEAGNVRFQVNTQVAQEAGLKPSAKLLQVGKVVTTDPTLED